MFHCYCSSCSLQYESFSALSCNLYIYSSERNPRCTTDPCIALTCYSFKLNRFHPWTSIILGFLPVFSLMWQFSTQCSYCSSLKNALAFTCVERSKLVNYWTCCAKERQIILGQRSQPEPFNPCKIFSKARNNWGFIFLYFITLRMRTLVFLGVHLSGWYSMDLSISVLYLPVRSLLQEWDRDLALIYNSVNYVDKGMLGTAHSENLWELRFPWFFIYLLCGKVEVGLFVTWFWVVFC